MDAKELNELSWLDQSPADPIEKARRVLGHLIEPDAAYFFGDGFPRTNVIAEQAKNVLAVLSALAAVHSDAEQAPVAWMLEVPTESKRWYTSGETAMQHWVSKGAIATPLYTTPVPPGAAAQGEAVRVDVPAWVHELKTDPEVFAAVFDGSKTHEIRFNDRDFKVGDTLRLRETRYTGQEMRGPEPRPLEFTGREVTRVVSHVLEGYGLQPGWVILSFAAPSTGDQA